MDKSIILDLVFGSDIYGEKIAACNIPEYYKNYDALFAIVNELCKNMPKDEQRRIENKVSDAIGGAESVAVDEYFKAGFKLGLTLGAQTFLD